MLGSQSKLQLVIESSSAVAQRSLGHCYVKSRRKLEEIERTHPVSHWLVWQGQLPTICHYPLNSSC